MQCLIWVVSIVWHCLCFQLNLKNVMDSLHEKLPDLLPQQGTEKRERERERVRERERERERELLYLWWISSCLLKKLFNLKFEFPSHIAAVLHYLMEDEDPCMITLEEYINLEEQPFDVVLESGKFSGNTCTVCNG